GYFGSGSVMMLDDDKQLHFRRLDVGDEPQLETAAEALLEAVDLGGQLGAGDEDLFACFVEGVEGVEELLHRLLLVAEELDVIEQEDVALLAVASAKLRHAVLLERVDEIVGERLAREIDDVAIGVLLESMVADRVHQVRLAQTHAAVEEERVVGLAGRVGDGGAGRDGELI